jgi:HAD superfamily hydrolase (TIGR01509 family)
MADRDIRLVCFDLGRVLVQLVDGWPHACQLAGVVTDNVAWTPAKRDRVSLLNHHYEKGELTCEAFRRQVADELACEPGHVEAIYGQWIRGPFPGVAELIDELHASGAGINTACLSNTNAHHWSIMMGHPRFAPLQKLRHPFASHLIRHAKPDPRIYAHVEERLGLAPAQIVFFDDLHENVHTAAARGWLAHTIDTVIDPVVQIRQVLRKYSVI